MQRETIRPLVIETISVANKNVTSTYDKREESYLIPSKYKYEEYIKEEHEIVTGIFLENEFVLVEHEIKKKPNMTYKEELEYLAENKFKYTHINYTEIGANYTEAKIRNIESILSREINKHINPHKTHLQLIIIDFIQKDEIISLIDIFINTCGFKCIQIIPMGVLIAIKLREPSCAFVYYKDNMKLGYVFMDDFALLDTKICEYAHKISNKADNEDVADEFTRLKTINYLNKFTCVKCDYYEDIAEKIRKHLEKDHKIKEKYDEFIFELKDENSFEDLVKYLYSSKKKRIDDNCYNVQINYNKLNDDVSTSDKTLHITLEDISTGAFTLKELETSKELWLTNKEWELGRLRTLKEKILFYI